MWVCRGCNGPIEDGEMRRGDDWHARCWRNQFGEFEKRTERQKKKSKPRKEPDTKAPDGFLLGGRRKVRKDGTVLFHRTYWKVPDEWIGERIWLHVMDGFAIQVEAAPPGQQITDCAYGSSDWMRAPEERRNRKLEPADRPGAKPGFRNMAHRDWMRRNSSDC